MPHYGWSYCESEYMSTGVVRKESDVYSFGMVLFEVICGRMCVVIDADGFLLSASLVKDYYKKKKLNKIVDPALSGQLRFESMNIFLSIAHQCLHDDRELRPPMNVVMEELDDLLKLELLHLSGALEASSTISLECDAIGHVIKKTWEFKSQLTQIEETIRVNKPIINKWQKLNELLDRPQEEIDMFIGQLKGAEHLVLKCEHIEQNFYKRYRQSLKLEDLNASLLRFFRIDVQLQEARDVKEVLEVVKDVQKRMEKQSFSGWSPLLKGAVVGLDDQVSTLKQLVFRDSAINDCSVVVVTAAGGCGKTTLVTKFCHDPEVQGKFRRHIYFATISSTPSLKVIIKNLIQKNQGGQQSDFTSDEDAIHKWRSFLSENKSEVLLVLDDVRDASIVTAFKFKSPGYTRF
ncbi:putative protein kinase RLK-Pelle-LRR-I-1 family [Helianthus annuus]|nr:putative protein kinase RLK-Pelle-LRR-I-1 family [Helianthus annuus]